MMHSNRDLLSGARRVVSSTGFFFPPSSGDPFARLTKLSPRRCERMKP